MPMIICKVILKLKWIKNAFYLHLVIKKVTPILMILFLLFIFTIPVVILSAKTINSYQIFLGNDLENQCIGMNMKKTETKNTTDEYTIYIYILPRIKLCRS